MVLLLLSTSLPGYTWQMAALVKKPWAGLRAWGLVPICCGPGDPANTASPGPGAAAPTVASSRSGRDLGGEPGCLLWLCSAKASELGQVTSTLRISAPSSEKREQKSSHPAGPQGGSQSGLHVQYPDTAIVRH